MYDGKPYKLMDMFELSFVKRFNTSIVEDEDKLARYFVAPLLKILASYENGKVWLIRKSLNKEDLAEFVEEHSLTNLDNIRENIHFTANASREEISFLRNLAEKFRLADDLDPGFVIFNLRQPGKNPVINFRLGDIQFKLQRPYMILIMRQNKNKSLLENYGDLLVKYGTAEFLIDSCIRSLQTTGITNLKYNTYLYFWEDIPTMVDLAVFNRLQVLDKIDLRSSFRHFSTIVQSDLSQTDQKFKNNETEASLLRSIRHIKEDDFGTTYKNQTEETYKRRLLNSSIKDTKYSFGNNIDSERINRILYKSPVVLSLPGQQVSTYDDRRIIYEQYRISDTITAKKYPVSDNLFDQIKNNKDSRMSNLSLQYPSNRIIDVDQAIKEIKMSAKMEREQTKVEYKQLFTNFETKIAKEVVDIKKDIKGIQEGMDELKSQFKNLAMLIAQNR